MADEAVRIQADHAALGRAVLDHLVCQVAVGARADRQRIRMAENAGLVAVVDGFQARALADMGKVNHDTLAVHLAHRLLAPIGQAAICLIQAAAAVKVRLHVGQLADLEAKLSHNGPLVKIAAHCRRVLQAENHAGLSGLLCRFNIFNRLDLHDLVGMIFEEIVIPIHILQNTLEACLRRRERNALYVDTGLPDSLKIRHTAALRRLRIYEVAAQAVNEQVFVVQFLRTLFLCFGQCNRFHMKSLLLVCFFISGDITQRFKNLLQLCDTPQNGAAHIPRAPAPAPGRSPLHTDTAERTGSLWAVQRRWPPRLRP